MNKKKKKNEKKRKNTKDETVKSEYKRKKEKKQYGMDVVSSTNGNLIVRMFMRSVFKYHFQQHSIAWNSLFRPTH